MERIKKVDEMLNYPNSLGLLPIPIKFTSNDDDNLKKISKLLESLSSKWSDYVEDHDEMEGSDTEWMIRQLSLVARKIVGEWDEQICF